MSMLSLLREQLGQPERPTDDFRVKSGSPARYVLNVDPGFVKSISAVRILAKRHVPLLVAKRAAERLLMAEEAIVDVPMLEDATTFEGELQELGVRALREISAAAE